MILCGTMRPHPDSSKGASTVPGARVMILDGIRIKVRSRVWVRVRVKSRAGVAAALIQLSPQPQETGIVECTLPPLRH